jgi:hypothetical protein
MQPMKVHYHVHNSLPFAPTLSQTDSLYALQFHFTNIYFNIILRYKLKCTKWQLGFPTKNMYAFSSSPTRVTSTLISAEKHKSFLKLSLKFCKNSLLLRLRMRGVILPFPYAFIAHRGTNLASIPPNCCLLLLPVINMVLPGLARPSRLTEIMQAD